MRFEYFVGWRYFTSRQGPSFISLITWLSTIGVAIGVMVLIMVIAVMSGAERELRDRVLSIQPHVLLARLDGPMADWRALAGRLAADGAVARVAPVAYAPGVLRSPAGLSGAFLKSYDPLHPPAPLAAQLAEAQRGAPGGEAASAPVPRLYLGKALAEELKTAPGGMLELMLMARGEGAEPRLPAAQRFVVGGIFSTGMHEYDKTLAFAALADIQAATGAGQAVSGLEIFVHDIFAADLFATRVGGELGYPHWCRSWMQMNRNFFTSLRQQKAMMFIILVLIILVAAFNIASALIMMATQKRRDIAILKAMGARAGSVARIFAFKGLLIGLCGTAAGTLLGVAGCQVLARYQFVELPPDVYFFTTLPVSLRLADVLAIAATTLALCLAASIYPALRAARLDPVSAIRGG
jgi:lipoprotein-releasing system permease protein